MKPMRIVSLEIWPNEKLEMLEKAMAEHAVITDLSLILSPEDVDLIYVTEYRKQTEIESN